MQGKAKKYLNNLDELDVYVRSRFHEIQQLKGKLVSNVQIGVDKVVLTFDDGVVMRIKNLTELAVDSDGKIDEGYFLSDKSSFKEVSWTLLLLLEEILMWYGKEKEEIEGAGVMGFPHEELKTSVIKSKLKLGRK